MTNTNRPGNDEPDFSNDKVADLVLHKDDEPLFDTEAGDAPETVSAEEWTGDGVNNGDCWFPIHFTYEGKTHTADVQKKPGVSAEYHVSSISPAIDHIPEPFVIAEHFTEEGYDFPVNETYYPHAFGNTVIKAIEDGSNEAKS